MATTASLHKNRKTTLGRIKGFIAKGPLAKDPSIKTNHGIPTFHSQLYSDSSPVSSIEHWALPGPHGSWKQHTFQDVIAQEFTPVKVGGSFGPTWSTHWFKVHFTVPKLWKGQEVHLRWDSSSEASLWDSNGNLIGAFSPEFRHEYIISKSWTGDDVSFIFYVEMACNGMFGGMSGNSFSIGPPDPDAQFCLKLVDIASLDREAVKLFTDLEMLHGMASELSENDQRGYQAMFAANEMINLIISGNKMKASLVAHKFFEEGNGKKAHTLVAMGHCHIDTAWLWPYDETIRKCARSWLSQINLMKQYPEFVFTCSQAQQFEWIKQYYPGLFQEIKEFVAKGRFIPVGGTWVEMDGLIPSGESFMRQFYFGCKFFKEEFGVRCKEFWLPDTFGYSGQIPQIMKHVGVNRFLTQKLSWSLVNKFPHHNFWWEGIDGSKVIVHFPPGDSYTMSATVAELLKSTNNSLDKGRTNHGAYLFGHGDGGGGPTATMIERLNRVKDVDGLPKVIMGGPDMFFEKLLEDENKLCKWAGELYLELHNGTYTSQAKIKWYNRKAEFLLREVELLMSIGHTFQQLSDKDMQETTAVVDGCWKNVLLNQFHDVLPGSCTEDVKDDAWKIYEDVFSQLHQIQDLIHRKILGLGADTGDYHVFNPLPWAVCTVIFTKDLKKEVESSCIEHVIFGTDESKELTFAALVNLSPSGYSNFEPLMPKRNVSTSVSNQLIEIENGRLAVKVRIVEGIPTESVVLIAKDHSEITVLQPNMDQGMMFIYDDVPLFWDAWDCMDYHLETRQELDLSDIKKVELICKGPIVGIYKWGAKFGKNESSFVRYTIIRADSPILEYFLEVDWRESHKFLKVEFPVDILAKEATYEIQYGHLKRPTHMNTSWDAAKFEVSGHKWMDVSQADKGVTFITDSKYGWHVRDNVVQLSLLRSPKSPDANCDMHKHFIRYGVLPHEGSFQQAGVIRAAYEFNFFSASTNVPLLRSSLDGDLIPNNYISSSNPAAIIEAVKVAPAERRAICIRVYESFGGSAMSRIQLGFEVRNVIECNGLEEPHSGGPYTVVENGFQVNLSPFEIKSFLIYF